jgi:2',3'-cyclic-nucleotide 2'-phosphodiesterase (5'-nucleotidase family)
MQKLSLLFLSLLLFSCQQQTANLNQGNEDHTRRLIILYTNDEHGWMEPNNENGGAPGLMSLWKNSDDFQIDGPFLVLSGGDMWTGPAISTLTSGKAMVEVMNVMGYSAAALGNHEFDFTIDTLRKRISEMDFPILAANIREKESGMRADFTLPYIIKDVNDISIGIIGLTTLSVPTTTKPANVTEYVFTPYARELREIVPRVKSEGAELIILIGHLCHDEMRELAPLAHEFGIPVIGGGHCHQLFEETFEGVTLIQSGSQYNNYAKVELFFDDFADTVISISSSVHENSDSSRDMSVESVVSKWRNRLDETLMEVIGYTSSDIPQKSPEMQNMITDSWLFVYPSAQVALTNTGGIRQLIPKGKITNEMIFGLLPFQNNILELDLRGRELLDCLGRDIVFSGIIKTEDGYKMADGGILFSDSTYKVLTNDYLYSRSDLNYQKYDKEPYDTSIHYRQPLIDWLRSINSTVENPINTHLDKHSRR